MRALVVAMRVPGGYDGQNNLTTVTEEINGQTRTTTYSYDGVNRLIQETSVRDGQTVLTVTYTYCTNEDGYPTTRVSSKAIEGLNYYYKVWSYDNAGNLVASYDYDAYGMLLSYGGYSSAAALATLNPLRYRGYVYDAETGLYYLQSRYYNPELGRFISPDSFVATGQGQLGNNMFAYCNNNPVNFIDRDGKSAEAFQWWSGGMWWLCGADTVLPVGDIIYGAGVLILGVYALTVVDEVTTPRISLEEEKEEAEPEPPDVTYPGDDPAKAPEGTEWKGKGKQGSKQGNYHDPETGESWHPDLNHPDGINPHWDYNYRGSGVKGWRVFGNGKIELKK